MLSTVTWVCLQLLNLPGNAQAKIEGVSKLLLNHVSQMPSKMPMGVLQAAEANAGSSVADMTRRIAVCHMMLVS